MYYESPRNIGGMAGLTWSVKFLLVVNVAIFILDSMISPDPHNRVLASRFALHGNWWADFRFGQLFTYMFIHGTAGHLFSNMLGLFFIGPIVERTVGSYRFFILYYVSGILGGLGWSLLAKPYMALDPTIGELVSTYPICVGASGAVMGVLGAFAAFYPNAQLLLWFVLPVRAWVLVTLFAFWELHETMGQPVFGGIANAAHLVGTVAGCSYALALRYPHVVRRIQSRLPGGRNAPGSPPPPRPEILSKEEIDRILDKIGKEGMGALTPRERELLKRATR